MKKYRLLGPDEIFRKNDEVRYVVNGRVKWWTPGGSGFLVRDSMLGRQYRRKISK